ncbi:MAG TPA: zf-HC2 domain-containing protein [Ktedonobacterales bacterium]
MTRETLVCQANIALDTLSALRDAALPAAEAQRLRAHIPTCAACQARLADFEAVASALRSQRELNPGDRILNGAHARIAGRSAPSFHGMRMLDMTNKRRLWAGLAALAPAAAIILLFVYVFTGIGHQSRLATTPTPNKTLVPTTTPSVVQVPTFTPSVPAEQAWRSFKPAIDVTFKPSGTTEFIPDVFSSDLTSIGGVLFDAANSGPQPAQLAYYTIATGQITKLSPTWNGYTGPWGGMLAMDSRYIVYTYNSQPGGTCGVCHNTLWSLDRATGKTWNFNANAGGDETELVSADHVVFASVTGQVWVADLVAHTVKVALPIGSQPYGPSSQVTADERLLGFQWPYLMYAETSATTPNAQQPPTTLNILDLATGVSTPIQTTMRDQSGNPVDPNTVGTLALVGTTLYAQVGAGLNGVDAHGKPVNLNYGSLYRLDSAFTPGNKFIAVAFWPYSDKNLSATMVATRHLIWLGSGYFWDNAELRLVSTSLTSADLVGADIVTFEEQQPGAPLQTYHVLAYDTSAFPTPPGW